MAKLNTAYEVFRMRAPIDVGSPPADADIDASWPLDEWGELHPWPPPPNRRRASIRNLMTALVCLAAAMVVVVFVAAIGYDWSLGTP